MIFIYLLFYINIYNEYIEKSYSDFNNNKLKNLLILDYLYDYHSDFSKFEQILNSTDEKPEPIMSYIQLKHALNKGDFANIKKIKEKLGFLNKLYISYSKHCEIPNKFYEIDYKSDSDGILDLNDYFYIEKKGCFFVKGIYTKKYLYAGIFDEFETSDKKSFKDYSVYNPAIIETKNKNFLIKINYSGKNLISFRQSDKKEKVEFTNDDFTNYLLSNFYNTTKPKIKPENDYPFLSNLFYLNSLESFEEKYDFINSVKDEILKKYLYFKYYKNVKNDFKQKEIINELFDNFKDIFLIIPEYLNNSENIVEKTIILNDIYKNFNKNKGILREYSTFFIKNELENEVLNKLEFDFLNNSSHIYNLVNYYYKKGIENFIEKFNFLYNIHYHNTFLLSEYFKFIKFYNNYFDEKYITEFVKQNPIVYSLVGIIYLSKKEYSKAIDVFKNVLSKKNDFKDISDLLSVLQPKKEINIDEIIKYKDNIKDFNKNKTQILMKEKNIILNSQFDYEINFKEIIYFKDTNIKHYDIDYIELEERPEVEDVFLIHSDNSVEILDNYDILSISGDNNVYTDYKIKRYYFDGKIADGDVFYINYTLKSSELRKYFDNNFSYFEDISSEFIINEYSVNITYPSDKYLKVFTSGDSISKKEKENKKNKTKEIKLTITDTEELNFEKYMPPLTDITPYFIITSYKSWFEVTKWFDSIMLKNYSLNEKNKEFFLNSVKQQNLNNKKDILKYLYNYVIQNIRYIGIELGTHSYKPYSPDIVIENNYGDCKDKSILFINILKLFDIEAELILLRTQNLGFIKEISSIPSYLYFNHAIVYVKEFDLYIDLSDKNIPFGELHFNSIKGTALHISHQKLTTIDLKVTNSTETTFTIKKSNESDLNISINQERKGVYAYYFRNGSIEKEGINFFDKLLHKYYKAIIDIKSFKLNNLKDLNKNTGFFINFDIKNILNDNSVELPLFYQEDFLTPLFANENIRMHNIKIPYSYTDKKIFVFENVKQIKNFGNFKIENDYFDFELKKENNKITYTFTMKENYISSEEYIQFKHEFKNLDEILEQKYNIIFEE